MLNIASRKNGNTWEEMENNKLINDKNIKFIKELEKNSEKTIHFIGLGGIGMSGLARFLIGLGYNVSGSDIKENRLTELISDQGGTVFIGHSSENVNNAAIIAVSTAIKESNPEIIEAKKKNIPIVHRSQVLEALMSGLGCSEKPVSIGFAGTHGKTTTSGMASLIFEDAGLDPSFVVGGQMPYLKTNSKQGKGEYFIAELDESDGTIEAYSPDISVITNLEFDHPDHYKGGIEQVFNTFERYVNKLKPNSKIIINADCAGNRELLKRVNHSGIILYSIDPDNNLYNQATYTVGEISVKGLHTKAQVFKNNNLVGELNLNIPGIHNVSNALSTIAAALECGLEFEKIAYSLFRFTGMKRRFQIIGTVNEAKIIDDYAHHPTEIQVTLKAAKNVVESNEKGRVVAIFQPHRYSRLASLWNDFIKSFKDADIIYVCDVYSAGESPIENISSEKFCQEIPHNNVHYIPGSVEEVADFIYSKIQPDDMILTIGAGDITRLGNIIIEKVESNRTIKA